MVLDFRGYIRYTTDTSGLTRILGKPSKAGMTVVEVLVAITLLAASLGAVYTAITFASRVSQHNVEKTMALNLAIERMDQVKNNAYAAIVSANFPDESGLTVGSYPIGFNRSVSIGISNYKTVTVTVTWSHLGWPFVETEEISTIISSS